MRESYETYESTRITCTAAHSFNMNKFIYTLLQSGDYGQLKYYVEVDNSKEKCNK